LGDLADARAVDPLIDALASSNWRIRQAATVGARQDRGSAGDRAPRGLPWRTATGTSARLRPQRSAGSGDPRAIEPLVAALLASDAEVRRAASEALASIGWAPRNAGERAAWSIANDAWSTCVEIGVPAVEPLVTVLGVGGASGRQAAASALGMIGDPRAIDPLVAALRDYYAHVRETSATALGMIGDPRAIDPLVAALRDAYPEVRQAAAGALGEIGGAAVGPLIAVFDDPGSRAEERVWAARSLVEIYQSGRLGEAARLDILRRRQEIEHTHSDVQGGASCTKPSRHTDLGAVFDG
jgi:HEAT repeat protein